MNRSEVVKLVIETVIKIQELSGREVPPDVNENTEPIGGLRGFDSLNGIELTVMISGQIARRGEKNLCVSEDGRKALNIGQIAERLLGGG
jgi:hypothetical protein